MFVALRSSCSQNVVKTTQNYQSQLLRDGASYPPDGTSVSVQLDGTHRPMSCSWEGHQLQAVEFCGNCSGGIVVYMIGCVAKKTTTTMTTMSSSINTRLECKLVASSSPRPEIWVAEAHLATRIYLHVTRKQIGDVVFLLVTTSSRTLVFGRRK